MLQYGGGNYYAYILLCTDAETDGRTGEPHSEDGDTVNCQMEL